MTPKNLTKLLQFIKEAIKHSRPAYKDYLGEETITKTTVIAEGTLKDYTEQFQQMSLKDSYFTGLVKGEVYNVTIGEDTYQAIPEYIEGTNTVVLSSESSFFDVWVKLESGEEPPPNFWAFIAMPDPEGIYVASLSHGSFVGKIISVSQTKITIEKKYDIKKLSDELLPDSVGKKADVSKAAKRANEAYQLANDANWTADNAQTTADNAQTTADNAQTEIGKAIKFEPQSLTDEQKYVARENIKALSDKQPSRIIFQDLTSYEFYEQYYYSGNSTSDICLYKTDRSYFLNSKLAVIAKEKQSGCLYIGMGTFLNELIKSPSFVESFPFDQNTSYIDTFGVNISDEPLPPVLIVYNPFTKKISSFSTTKNIDVELSTTSYSLSNELSKMEIFDYIRRGESLTCLYLGSTTPGSAKKLSISCDDSGPFYYLDNKKARFMADNQDYLLYSIQLLSEDEKRIARNNIGAISADSIPVDNTTIKLNDEGQLTLALSNANGVSF